ncbi:MAG TPA: hypothetical protein VN709_11070 [Terriglobales bacterium]|nr:hypothetical protein [Terriglobales bacterium]
MKTTLEIADSLLLEAKARARSKRMPLRRLVEEGLRLALERDNAPAKPFKLRDASVGSGGMLVKDWAEIKRLNYEGRGGD